MDFKGYFMKGVELVKLNRDAASEVAADEGAFGMAVVFFAIGGLAAGLAGTAVSMGAGVALIIFGPIMQVIGSFISVGILYLIAKMLGGTGGFKGYYSALGIGSIPQWAQFVPFVGWLVSLWSLPVSVIVTERVHNLSFGKAVAVVVIPFLIVAFLFVLAIAFVGTAAILGVVGAMGARGM
ncbi:MAG: YIP1 family protein [Nitrospirae bacterium]|nr:YIP1 family protein [Nitrospirota bacterium]MBI5696795.1 YIP1 family protein [Nitrospirota bacterium]